MLTDGARNGRCDDPLSQPNWFGVLLLIRSDEILGGGLFALQGKEGRGRSKGSWQRREKQAASM